MTCKPKKLPLPKNSRMMPMIVRATVKPSPVATPSTALSRTGFLLANASARPKMIQLTTMSGKKTPMESYKSGIYFSRTILSKVTIVAIITINAGMRTVLGMTLRRREMSTLLNNRTTVTESPMPKLLRAEVDIPRVAQVPRTSLKVALFVIRPS